MSVSFKSCLQELSMLTKRKMIAVINSVYDVLGWSSPVMIVAKLLFSRVCQLKQHWDDVVPDEIKKRMACLGEPAKKPRSSDCAKKRGVYSRKSIRDAWVF